MFARRVAVPRSLVRVLACSFLLGCSNAEQPGSDLDRLTAAEARWHAAGIHNYDYVIGFSCGLCVFPLRPVSVQVRGDTTMSVRYVDDGSPVDTARLSGFGTIDGTFEALRRDLLLEPDRFNAVYDARLGYPMNAFVDMHTDAADDESGFTISELTVR